MSITTVPAPAALALDAATLERLVAAAVAAPSIHNTQPWRFQYDPDTATLAVHSDHVRNPRHTDPVGRALYLSVGAAVFNLRVAARHLGRAARVRLLPEPADPTLLAAVRLTALPPRARGRHQALYDALWRRHTSRLPFADHRVPPQLLGELADAAHIGGTVLYTPDRQETVRLLHLTRRAEQRNTRDDDRSAESRRAISGPAGSPYGIPGSALGPQDSAGRLPMRDFSALRSPGLLPAAPFETTPTVAVLATAHDTRADWLRAGQALEHVLLLATAAGVRTSLFHQALEWPDLRWALRDPARDQHLHVQMLIRFGYGTTRPATPRRTPADVLADLPD
ncbi:Acg family FMN-binding oxidoreductase [Peterkaempfera bronchialis]|uniref:Acg family FMN-binding oxidoreductase n=1 Tax=Peterkaempfera bronchialis TaxID=2126346 RepID=UPI000DAC27D6|nr:hypothetical protein [Peterkaempfera bronchialis]